jgi:AcrR family transcriptional regulator
MQARKEARRRRFLEVATRLFGERGFHRTTVPAVVARSGSSVGSFYMYFDNKEALFAEVLRDVEHRLAAHLNLVVEGREDPLERMRAAVEALFQFLAEHPEVGRILLVESSGLGADLERVRREILASHARSVESSLRRIMPAANSKDVPVLARCWVGAVYEAVRYWMELGPGRRPPARDIARQVARFNLGAIGCGEGAPAGLGPARTRRRPRRGQS